MKKTDFALVAFAWQLAMTAGSVSAQANSPTKPDANFDASHAVPQDATPKRPGSTAAALAQAPVDFNHPPREYVSHRLHGWDLLVEKPLEDDTPDRAKMARARLEVNLGIITKTLPTDAIKDLQRVKVFLMHGSKARKGGREFGLEYFRGDAPKHHDWLDARMASSIVIFNAENYLSLTDEWALKSLMHEFGHAQHLEHWPEDNADIFSAWEAAMKSGLYKTVRDEDKATHNPNYAAQNHLEYFAELSTTYFVGNTYFPRQRAELKVYDPVGYALIETLWGSSGEGKDTTGSQP